MKIIEELPKINPDIAISVEAVPVGLYGSLQLYDQRTVDILGIKNLKEIGRRLLDASNLEKLEKISEENSDQCLEFLMNLDYEEHKSFLNCVHQISFMSNNDCAEILEALEAASACEDVGLMAIDAFFNKREMFDLALNKITQTQDIAQRSYSVFTQKPGTIALPDLSDALLLNFEERVRLLCEERKFGELCRVAKINDQVRIGVCIEHGTKRAGEALVDEKAAPMSAALRFRNTDFIFLDKTGRSLWVNSKIFSKATKARLLEELGGLLCGDERAFASEQKVNFELFNTTIFADQIKDLNIPGIKKAEVRLLTHFNEGYGRNSGTLRGPLNHGCVTDLPDWKAGIPERWRTSALHLTYETGDGHRETIALTNRAVRLTCTGNFSLTVALLKKLKIIPNHDN